MKRIARHMSWVILIATGLGALTGYAAVLVSSDNPETWRESAILAGCGAALVIAGGLVFIGLRGGRQLIRFLPLWVGIFGLVGAIGVGAYVARSDRWPALDPLFALVAIASTWLSFAAIVVRWSHGRIANRGVVLGPTIWGMTAAPALALVLELIFAVALVAGGVAGLYCADPELLRSMNNTGIESVIESSGKDLLGTVTVIIGIAAIYAIAAPLAEEFAKLLGTVAFLRPASATHFDAYISGVFTGLGFASVETMVYALVAGEQWPLLAALRAPVAVIHTTAAAAAALGWYAGGRGIVSGFAFAVLVHGAWNGLTVSALVLSASVDDPEALSPLAALASLAIVGAMFVMFTGCAIWLVHSARKHGCAATDHEPPARTGTPVESSPILERTAPVTGASLGSI